MELVFDSVLLFGRASLGATAGFMIGTLSQRDRHVRWALCWLLLGFGLGVVAMSPQWSAMLAAVVLLVPSAIGAFAGLVTGAGTLGDREDWYLRALGFAGFLGTFHGLAIIAQWMTG